MGGVNEQREMTKHGCVKEVHGCTSCLPALTLSPSHQQERKKSYCTTNRAGEMGSQFSMHAFALHENRTKLFRPLGTRDSSLLTCPGICNDGGGLRLRSDELLDLGRHDDAVLVPVSRHCTPRGRELASP